MLRILWRYWSPLRMLPVMAALIAGMQPVVADLDTEIEKGLGNWLAQAFIAQRGRLDQPPINEWISRLGGQLVAHTPRDDIEYHFVVLDSPEANGFALPGGWVFVTAGLLETMESEDELAAVMAHELGHLANHDFQRVMLRTALWLGLAEMLRGNDREDWVPVARGAQLVETLHHSREREARADATGAEIAWHAGYDPRAMAAFLGDEPQWSYLQTVFATHPHPAKRADRLHARFETLRAEDPQGALSLAQSLIDRGRHRRACEMLEQPLSRSHEEERAELLDRVSASAGIGVGNGRDALASDRLEQVKSAGAALRQAREKTEEARKLAWRRLRRLWDDSQVERALVVAQAFDPELDDSGYILLLVQSINALHRAMRGANLVARTLSMRADVAGEMRRLAGRVKSVKVESQYVSALNGQADVLDTELRTLAETTDAHSSELARLAGEYHECARLVAPLLVELALAGDGDPAGRLTFARFMLIEGRVRLLDERLGHLDDSSDCIASAVWRTDVVRSRLHLNLAALQAGESLRDSIFSIVSRRGGVEPAVFDQAWASGVMPGDRLLDLLAGRMRSEHDSFGEDLRATQILMRISSIEVKEQVDWSAKEKCASEGAVTLALCSAVRHPQ